MTTVAERERAGRSARELLRRERHGVLATMSLAVPLHPFGSLVPYALDRRGEPILLLSDLAEHTRNLLADARSSLLVQDSAALQDPQAGARLTLVGRTQPVAGADEEACRELYLARFPAARAYLGTHGFRCHRLAVRQARFIGGFGVIHWLPAEALLDAETPADSG